MVCTKFQGHRPKKKKSTSVKKKKSFSIYAVKKSRSTQDYHLNKLAASHILDAAYQVSRFQKRRLVKVFNIYGHGGHIGHVT